MNDLLFVHNLTEESLKFLIASGADINIKNSEDKTPLYSACYNENFNIVKILIENGADKNTICWSTTAEIKKYLVQIGCPAPKKIIMEFGTEEQKKNHKITFEDLCDNLNIQDLKNYIDNGGNINKQSMGRYNFTLLHHAVNKGMVDCVSYLVEKGADTLIKDKLGRVPARLVTDKFEIYSILKENINEPDNDGNNILHISSKNLRKECIRYLIGIGARFNIKNNEGKTAFDLCSDKNIFKSREDLLREFVGNDIKWAIKTLLETV